MPGTRTELCPCVVYGLASDFRKVTLRYVGCGTTFAHLPAEGSTVVAFVGVEFSYPTPGSHTQLIHGRFSTDNVVTVAFECHIRQRQTIALSQ